MATSGPPISTVGQPMAIMPPWPVGSVIRAAGRPPMSTLSDPLTITSGTWPQAAASPTRAAGNPPISTVGQPGGRIGPPPCTGHVCASLILAAGNTLATLGFPSRNDQQCFVENVPPRSIERTLLVCELTQMGQRLVCRVASPRSRGHRSARSAAVATYCRGDASRACSRSASNSARFSATPGNSGLARLAAR